MAREHSVAQLVDYWKRQGLGTRASHVLSKADISRTGLAAYETVEDLICIKNCGAQTAQEIWNFGKTYFKQDLKEVSFEDLIPR